MVTRDDGRLAVGRLGAIFEQVFPTAFSQNKRVNFKNSNIPYLVSALIIS